MEKGRIDGVLVVDKEEGITSYDVIRKVKRYLRGVKIGYLGTLDPLATGVLPLLIGEGTKLAPFLENGQKVYDATIKLGVTTDTQDKDGQVIREEDLSRWDLTPERIEEVLGEFRGRIKQIPPMFSSKKYRGRPLYKLARRGIEVEREPKEVEIYELELKEVKLPFVRIYLRCSKGTYARTLAHDIGERLGCGGHLFALRRLSNGPFTEKEAMGLDEVVELASQGRLKEAIIPLGEALSFLPSVQLDDKEAWKVRHGGQIERGGEEGFLGLGRLLAPGGELLAVGEGVRVGRRVWIRPIRVFRIDQEEKEV